MPGMNFPRFGGGAASTPLASSRIPDIPFSALPREISRKLRGAAARIRRILFLRGLFAVLATALIAILVSMAVDYMVTFTGHTVRWVLWAIGVGAVAVVARQTLVKPLSQKFTPARLAALLERNHPELQERLSTVVELLSMPDAVGEGSELLLDVVKSAAESDVRGLSPSREFSIRTVKPRFFLTAAAVLVLTVLFLVWPDDVGRLFARAVVPAAEIDNVWADNLHVAPGRDEFVLEGEPYTIHLAVVGGFPGKAYVRCRPLDRSSGETSERMAESAATEEDGTGVRHYSHTIAAVDKSFSYYVVCGSAVTRAYDVVALPIPAFSKATVTLNYPTYTGAAPKTLDEGTLDVSAVEGTRVSLRIVPNGTRDRPVHSRLSFADDHVLDAEETDGSPVAWEFPVSAQNAGSYEIRLFDDNGFTNAPSAHSISLLKDEAPTIAFTSPTNLVFTLPAHGTVPVAYELKDDFGVSAPMLQAKVDSGAWHDLRPLPAEPSGSVAPVRSGAAEIRLSDLPVAPKAGAQFRLRARDNLPPSLGGPHDAFSPVIVVRLDGAARTIGSKRLQQAGEKAKAKAETIEKNLRDAMERTREARREQLANRPEQAAEKLAQAKEAIAKAEDKAREMMREMKDGDMAALAKDAKDLLEETLKPAREKADEAIAAKPEERVSEIDKLLEKLDGAADAAKDLQEKRKALEKELKAAQEITELSDKQKMLANELGKKMTEEEKKAWEEKQKALLDELKKKRDELSADPLAAQREQAEDLAKRYAALARRQQALENTAAALAKDPYAQPPHDALAKATPSLDPAVTDTERFVAAQEPLAREAEELARDVGALVRSLPVRALDDPSNPVTDARREANAARDRSRNAAEEARLRVEDEKNPPADEPPADAGSAEPAPAGSDEDDEFGGLDDLLTADDLAALDAAAGPRKDMDEEMRAAAAAEERAAQLLAASAKAIDELSKKMGEENAEAAKRAEEAMQAAMEALKNMEDPLAKQREKAEELARRFDELAGRQDRLSDEQGKKGASDKLADDQRELARDVADLRRELDDLVRTIPEKSQAAATVRGARSDSEEARREADGAAEEARLRADEKDGPKKEEPPPAPTKTDDFFGEEDEFGGGLDDLLTAEDLEAISHAGEPVRRDLAKSMERAEDALRRGKDKMDEAAKAIDELSKKLAEGSMQDPSQMQPMDPSQMQPMDPSQMQNQQNMDPSQMQNQQNMDPSQMQPMDPSQMQQMQGDPNAQRDWNGERDPNAETQNAEGDPNADRKWDGERDPNAEVPIGEWDPNAEHAPWDGKKDPNAQDEANKDGQWDPNAQRDPWDGKKDPNAKDEPPKDGEWDPNAKRDPWDGKLDPNAQQQQQQGQQQQQKGQQQQQQQQQGQQQQQQQQQGQQQQQPQNAQQQAQQQAQNAAQQMQQMAQQMQQQAGSQQQNQQQQQNGPQQQQQQQQGPQQPNQQQQQNQQNQPQNPQQQQNSQQQGPHQEHKPIDPNSIGEYNPLRNLGVSDNDWLRVQNGGGSEALDAAVEKVPPEYRDLVREYFQALANEK